MGAEDAHEAKMSAARWTSPFTYENHVAASRLMDVEPLSHRQYLEKFRALIREAMDHARRAGDGS